MLTKIIDKVKVDSLWQKVDLSKNNCCYLIAIKDKATKSDTIDVNSVRKIRFELGIDSGIKGKLLTVQYINLDFNDITSGNNEINKITAFTRLSNIPNEFYIRVSSIDDGQKEIKSGSTSISINVNALSII